MNSIALASGTESGGVDYPQGFRAQTCRYTDFGRNVIEKSRTKADRGHLVTPPRLVQALSSDRYPCILIVGDRLFHRFLLLLASIGQRSHEAFRQSRESLTAYPCFYVSMHTIKVKAGSFPSSLSPTPLFSPGALKLNREMYTSMYLEPLVLPACNPP